MSGEIMYQCPKCTRFYGEEIICPYCKDVMTRSGMARDIIKQLEAENKRLKEAMQDAYFFRDKTIAECNEERPEKVKQWLEEYEQGSSEVQSFSMWLIEQALKGE